VRVQGEEVLNRIKSKTRDNTRIMIVESVVEAGSGSLPQVPIPSIALMIENPGVNPNELAQRFRQARYPVVGYVRRGQYYIDLKAIPMEKSDLLVKAMEEVLKPS